MNSTKWRCNRCGVVFTKYDKDLENEFPIGTNIYCKCEVSPSPWELIYESFDEDIKQKQ